MHHSQITNCLRIIQPLLKLALFLTFTQPACIIHDLCYLELPTLNKVYPTGFLALPVHLIPPLILSLLEEESELAECRFVDPLADREPHEEVEHAVEPLLYLAQTHSLEVLLREHSQMGLGEG